MKTLANNTWKKIAACAMALTVMCGVAGAMGGKVLGSTLTVSAAAEQQDQAGDGYTITPCQNGTLQAELIQTKDQEFDALKVTPVPDAGYKLAALYADGDQVAINDNDEYLIAYHGDVINLYAEFVEAENYAFEILPCENGTVKAELVQSDDQEFDAILITPEPADGYRLDKVLADGQQVAINDKDQYLVAYNGKKITISAEFVATTLEEEAFEILPCENGELKAELVQSSDQEFDAVLVTPVPAKGYKVSKVMVNGEQVAINDKGEYLIAYEGKKLYLSAEFVADDNLPKTGAAVGVSAAAVAVAAAAVILTKKRK